MGISHLWDLLRDLGFSSDGRIYSPICSTHLGEVMKGSTYLREVMKRSTDMGEVTKGSTQLWDLMKESIFL